jgi:hypothetical protein
VIAGTSIGNGRIYVELRKFQSSPCVFRKFGPLPAKFRRPCLTGTPTKPFPNLEELVESGYRRLANVPAEQDAVPRWPSQLLDGDAGNSTDDLYDKVKEYIQSRKLRAEKMWLWIRIALSCTEKRETPVAV